MNFKWVNQLLLINLEYWLHWTKWTPRSFDLVLFKWGVFLCQQKWWCIPGTRFWLCTLVSLTVSGTCFVHLELSAGYDMKRSHTARLYTSDTHSYDEQVSLEESGWVLLLQTIIFVSDVGAIGLCKPVRATVRLLNKNGQPLLFLLGFSNMGGFRI